MPSGTRIIERLPSLYRPEPNAVAGDLVADFLGAVGSLLDDVNRGSSEVMQAHWFTYADSAVFSEWVRRTRELADLPPLSRDDPLIVDFPFLCDLPRIAALVDLSPWREPLTDKERVEDFRRRIRRVITLHKNGLGTVAALRTMTMAALPVAAPEAEVGLRERSFTVEEFTPNHTELRQALSRGKPEDMVGPLMRFDFDSQSTAPVLPTVYIEGVRPITDAVDPTEQPLIERFDPRTGTGIGLAYDGTLAASETVALLNAYHSWVGTEVGVLQATHVAGPGLGVNPTAPGPWLAATGAPVGTVQALAQTEDQFLWAAVNDGDGALWRSDGATWSEIITGLPELCCLLAHGRDLLVGCATGLCRLDIAPVSGVFELEPDPATLADAGVNGLARMADGVIWAATDIGAARLVGGVLVPDGLGETPASETVLRAVSEDADGTLLFGGELGMFQRRAPNDQWYFFSGEAIDEATPDWLPFDPAIGLPEPEQIFLPPVFSVRRGPDRGLWLGTERGIACYHAKEVRRTSTTLLQGLPGLTETMVHGIEVDERNRLWFATGSGLFVHDLLDWYQVVGGTVNRLPRVEVDSRDSEFWRFDRASSIWQVAAPPDAAGFLPFTGPRTAGDETPVRAIVWTDGVVPLLGSLNVAADSAEFVANPGAVSAAVRVRYKPTPDRAVEGGIPALPRLTPGTSDWRYLALEQPTPPTPSSLPAFTREGRLLPPPDLSEAPFEARYLTEREAKGLFDPVAFAFCPAARVWLQWGPRGALAVTVRLHRTTPEEIIDPIILDRVWTELERVRPAGVRVALAVEEDIMRGG